MEQPPATAGFAHVETENPLIEAGLQMFDADRKLHGAHQPPLLQREDTMTRRQHHMRLHLGAGDGHRGMDIALPGPCRVDQPTNRGDLTARLGVGIQERGRAGRAEPSASDIGQYHTADLEQSQLHLALRRRGRNVGLAICQQPRCAGPGR